jgi:hypothetical protein
LIARDAHVTDAKFLRLDALALEHAREHLADAVGGVGEPVGEAGYAVDFGARPSFQPALRGVGDFCCSDASAARRAMSERGRSGLVGAF